MNKTNLEKIKRIHAFLKERKDVTGISIILSCFIFFLPNTISHLGDFSVLFSSLILWICCSFIFMAIYAKEWLDSFDRIEASKNSEALSFVYINGVAIGSIPTYQYLSYKRDAFFSWWITKPITNLFISSFRILSYALFFYFIIYLSVDSAIFLSLDAVIERIKAFQNLDWLLAIAVFLWLPIHTFVGGFSLWMNDYDQSVGEKLRLHFNCVALGTVVVFDKDPKRAVDHE